jgi:hypothetical protein
MDWQAWGKALELYVNTPELIYASIFAAIAIFGFAWWLRNHISKETNCGTPGAVAPWQGGSRAHQKRIGLVEAKSFSTGGYH